jgi:hypothetical protein
VLCLLCGLVHQGEPAPNGAAGIVIIGKLESSPGQLGDGLGVLRLERDG